MKVFTSLRWILVAECPVLVSETTWGVCLLNPTLCLMVWGLDPPGTSQVMAWQTIKHIHVRTHKAHHLCSWGYRQLNYLFHSVFRSTLKNSSTLCIYGLVQVETSGKRWFPHRRLSVRERVCVKTSSYSLVTADALALKKDRSYACKMPAALHMITSSYWYSFCVTGLISGKSMGARLRWDMMTSQHGKFFALLILCYANPPLTYNHRNENIFQSRYDLRDKINNKTTV